MLINSFFSIFGVKLVRNSTIEKQPQTVAGDDVASLRAQANSISAELIKSFTALEQNIDTLRIEALRNQITNKWEIVDYLSRSIKHSDDPLTCPFCEFQARSPLFKTIASHCIFGGGTLIRRQCPGCDVIFGAMKMLDLSPAELAAEYEWHYRAYKEGDSTELEIRAFHALSPSKSGTYLNYGAGAWSKSVEILRDQGWNVFAYEPHSSAQTNADYVIADKTALQKMEFDGVFSNNVLEHLRYPIEELKFIRDLIKPGGRMAHATPCFAYLYEFTRFHLFFYLGRSRLLLADKTDMRIVAFISDDEFMCLVLER